MAESPTEWLLEGDPVVRWQVLRDVLGHPEIEWQAERARVPTEGWGAKFVDAMGPDYTWPEARWTGTVWTLVLLCDLGFPADHERVRQAAHKFLECHLTAERAASRKWLLQQMDLCHLGFWLRIGSYFGWPPERLRRLAEFLLDVQMADGGWNCRIRTTPTTRHSSFHTTFNVLEGLSEAADAGILSAETFRAAETRAIEFALVHRLYRSDRTGEVIDHRFTHLAYPTYWHYNVLRGLDYIRGIPEIGDERLEDPLRLLDEKRKPSGRWPVEHRIPGPTLFDMEAMGRDSRINTLRALRVLGARPKVR